MLLSICKSSYLNTKYQHVYLFQVFDTTVDFLGPLPEFLCILDFITKNVIALKVFLFLTAVIIVRYIFTFHSKNPTAVQDDFWVMFLNLWIVGMFLLTFYTCIFSTFINKIVPCEFGKYRLFIYNIYWINYNIFILHFLGFGVISQSVYLILPGKKPHPYYICTGSIPKKYNHSKPEPNNIFFGFLFISVLCHSFVFVRFLVYKCHQSHQVCIVKINSVLI